MKYSARERKSPVTPKSGGLFPRGKGFVTWQVNAAGLRANEVAEVEHAVEAVRHGLPYCELEALQELLDLPLENLAEKLGLSRATLHRRKQSGKLTSDESDKVIRFARRIERARNAFGSEEEARSWLGLPQFGLGGAVPLDYAQSEVGAREVEHLLGRIEYGVYS